MARWSPPLVACASALFVSSCTDPRPWAPAAPQGCDALLCHARSSLLVSPPQSGMHEAHLAKGSDCNTCHAGYYRNPLHINGELDVAAPAVIVGFDRTHAAAQWDADADTCADVACHGAAAEALAWYGGRGDCTRCHGEPSSRSHPRHLTEGLACTRCHEDYRTAPTHADGVLDPDGDAVVAFDAALAGASYDRDTDTCANVACHGDGTPQWGGELGCTDCHGVPPATGAHATHREKGGYDCAECHYERGADTVYHHDGSAEVNLETPLNPLGAYAPGATAGTGSCSNLYCHGTATPSWQGTAGCGSCHPIPGTSGAHPRHVLERGYGCTVCHSDPVHVDGTVDVHFDARNPAGAYVAGATPGTGTCNNLVCHGTGTPSWNGIVGCGDCHGAPPVTDAHLAHAAVGYACSECHLERGAGTPYHVDGSADVNVTTPRSPSATYVPGATPGTGTCSSVTCHGAGAPTWNGSVTCADCHGDPPTTGAHATHAARSYACSECHFERGTGTTYHADGIVDVNVTTSRSPSGSYVAGTTAGTGTCSAIACHGTGAPTWDGSVTCAECHNVALGTRRQVLDSNGDGTGTGGDFNRITHHVIDYASPSTQLVSQADCLVCHDQSAHTRGTIVLRDADNAGSSLTYVPSDPRTLEPFCLSCHDADGATREAAPLSPFSSPNTLGVFPNLGGSHIREAWEKAYGHGPNGGHVDGTRLTCVGSGAPRTGCHGSGGAVNAHGSDNTALATQPFFYDRAATGDYDEAKFALCFDCHANYAGITKEDTFGVLEGGRLDNPAWLSYCTACHFSYNPNLPPPYYTSGVTTRFVDHDEPGDPAGLNDGTNPYLAMPTDNNLHWLHVGFYMSRSRTSSTVAVTCSNCHNVHGTSAPVGMLHELLGYTRVTDANGNSYGQMRAEAYSDADGTPNYLAGYPTYCAMSCHEKTGPTRAWSSPISE